jgi:RNA polymerase sigma-70 factor (ECF subfamily)
MPEVIAIAGVITVWPDWLLGATARRSIGASAVESAIASAWLADGDAQALFGFVRRLGLTNEQADDAVQEVFTRLLAEHRAGVHIVNPRAWAYRSIYRLAMDQHRLRTRLASIIGGLGRGSEGGSVDETDRIAVWSEVDRLPLRQRQVVYLRYRSDLRFDEIADVLGVTSSAARSHATQAMATLRTRLGADRDEVGHGS